MSHNTLPRQVEDASPRRLFKRCPIRHPILMAKETTFQQIAQTLVLISALGAGSGCGVDGTSFDEPEPSAPPSPFATTVVDVVYGEGGGFGEHDLPGVVIGPPRGLGEALGSRDVLSLGVGGSITLAFDRPCPDGDGVDLLVFENAFRFGPNSIFTEPAIVEASADGEPFVAFACAPDEDAPNGCAGMAPVYAGRPNTEIDPLDPETAGGDAFDFGSLLGASSADDGALDVDDLAEGFQYVRITDVGGILGDDGTSGFDLDALACRTLAP